MGKECLYCRLQFAATTRFCPSCGRPTESGFTIRPLQEVEVDHLRTQVKQQDELIQHLILGWTRRSHVSCAK